MKPWPDDSGAAISRLVQHLHLRSTITPKVYRCILWGFQRFVMTHQAGAVLRQSTIEAWLRERAAKWPRHLVLHRACLVDRFLDFLVSEGSIPSNPLAALRARCAQRNTAPVATALLADAPDAAIAALTPMPRLASFLGDLMRHHIDLMRAVGYRYTTQAEPFARFD